MTGAQPQRPKTGGVVGPVPNRLSGRRIVLRPLASSDFVQWREVRRRNADWLLKWEPTPPSTHTDDTEDPGAFAARCGAREREWQLGTGYGFGIFLPGRTGEHFAGEINLSGIQRGPFQNAYVGYWIDQASAGHGYVPEALVLSARFAFERLGLHRLQVAIIPRNKPSRRVVEKLGLRDEGVALRYLAINGVWEDHIRYAITAEEWAELGATLCDQWLN